VAQRERIASISLEGKPNFQPYPVKNLKNVIAIEFDLKNNCLYWADIVDDVIGVGISIEIILMLEGRTAKK
jgi:hypothetical protein